MGIKKLFSAACALAVALSTSVYAAQSNNIVITATRTQANILSTPSQVNIITSQQLKNDGITYVQNALKYVPGISITSNGAFGGATSVYIRGLPACYTKTLIDGVDVSDPSLMKPYFNFANLFGNDISRIEIVQGAQSGLYGSNAIGGVINVITKRGKGKPYIKYSQKLGSFNTYQETLESGGALKSFNYYIEMSNFDTKGISKMDKYNPTSHSYSKGNEKDAYHKINFSSRIEYKPSDDLIIGDVIKAFGTRNYLDDGWYITPSYQYYPDDAAPANNTPTAKSYREIDHFFMSKFYIKKHLNNLFLNFDYFYVQNLRYYKSDPSGDTNYKGKRWGSNLTGTYSIKNSKLTLGLTQQMEKYKDSTNFKKLRYNYALFGEIQQRISGLNLQLVGREDTYKTFGSHFTYKIGMSYLLPNTETVLKADYGTGFRAPSIWELYAKPNPAWYFLGGNKNLRPEKAKTYSFGVIQNIMQTKGSVSLFLFRTIIKNRIEYSTDPKTYESTYKNVEGKTHTHGVEMEAKLNLTESIQTGLNYTYTRSINPDTGKQTPRIPLRTLTGFITLKTLNGKLTATVDGRYIGKRFDDANHTHQTGKYAVFDFTAIYKPAKRLELTLTVKNIFNRFYEEVYGYSTLPRSAFATISYTF